jgi:hypothetical protein
MNIRNKTGHFSSFPICWIITLLKRCAKKSPEKKDASALPDQGWDVIHCRSVEPVSGVLSAPGPIAVPGTGAHAPGSSYAGSNYLTV